MPRVVKRTKSARGASRSCGRCGATIAPGQPYFQFSFRYGGTHYRCKDHYPKPSELTQSKVSTIYAAVEEAEESLPGLDTFDDIAQVVDTVAEAAREVADEYREADEAFGGYGATQSAELADELEGWADELDSFQLTIEQPEVDEDAVEEELRTEGYSEEDEGEWTSVREERIREAEEALSTDDALEEARDEVREAIGGCPL